MIKEPRIIIKKSTRSLELFEGAALVKTSSVVLGRCAEGDKETEGDGRTPEGTFYVFVKNAESKFHLSLGISYPDVSAAQRGLAAGLISADEHDAIVAAISQNKRP